MTADAPPVLCVLLWQPANDAPWSLPGGSVGDDETLSVTARRRLAEQVGGRGGGKDDLAQGGGSDASPAPVSAASSSVAPW